MQNNDGMIPASVVADMLNFERRIRNMPKPQRAKFYKDLASKRPKLHQAMLAHVTLDVHAGTSSAGAERQRRNAVDFATAYYMELGGGAQAAQEAQPAIAAVGG